MVEDTRVYEGVPVGAFYEASLATLKGMDLVVSSDIRANQYISAYPKDSPRVAAKQIVLEMVEIETATRVTIKGGLIEPEPEGWGPTFLKSVLNRIEAEIQKIKDSGRIIAVEAPRYSFGQAASPPILPFSNAVANSATGASAAIPVSMPIHVDAPHPPVTNEKSSFSSWLLKVAIFAGIVIFFNTQQGQKIFNDIMNSLSMPTTIGQYTCEQIGKQVKGLMLQNAFGANFEVLRVSDYTELSRTEQKVVCTARIGLSNGVTDKMRISVEKGDSSTEAFVRIDPL